MIALFDLTEERPADDREEALLGLRVARELEMDGLAQLRLHTGWTGTGLLEQIKDARDLREHYVDKLVELANGAAL